MRNGFDESLDSRRFGLRVEVKGTTESVERISTSIILNRTHGLSSGSGISVSTTARGPSPTANLLNTPLSYPALSSILNFHAMEPPQTLNKPQDAVTNRKEHRYNRKPTKFKTLRHPEPEALVILLCCSPMDLWFKPELSICGKRRKTAVIALWRCLPAASTTRNPLQADRIQRVFLQVAHQLQKTEPIASMHSSMHSMVTPSDAAT